MMPRQYVKEGVIAAAVLLVLGGVMLFFYTGGEPAREQSEPEPIAEPAAPAVERSVIGTSVEGRTIERVTFGDGSTHLVFVGGIHGGYEWNSVLLAYRMIDHFEANPGAIPDNTSVTIVPSANPDGLYEVLGREGRFAAAEVPAGIDTSPGRFNARGVDLNRNFDCKWQPESTWRGSPVSAGDGPFSEPEARAIRDLVLEHEPSVVVFWHSQSNAVYASECEEGVLPATRTLMNTYANAAGYSAIESFDHYEITGDAEGWLASIGIPAITVELATHESVEWERNLAGVEALLGYYAQ